MQVLPGRAGAYTTIPGSFSLCMKLGKSSKRVKKNAVWLNPQDEERKENNSRTQALADGPFIGVSPASAAERHTAAGAGSNVGGHIHPQ